MRRPFAILLAVALFAAFARPARADDAKKATDAFMKGVMPTGVGAAATMQGVGNAAAAAAAGGASNGRKKDEGGFSRALTAPRIDKTADGGLDQAPSKKKPAAAAKSSKYRAANAAALEPTYRFDANGEPLTSAPKKKAPAKAKKKVESDDDGEKAGECSSAADCAPKKDDSNAF